MRFFYVSGIGVMLGMISCLPDPLPVDGIPQLKPKIVVSTQIIPNQSVLVFLTKSVGALGAGRDSDFEEMVEKIAINDALVIVYNESVRDTLTFLKAGLYASTSIPFEEGQAYSLIVESPSMGNVTATTQVKTQVLFNSLKASFYYTGFDTLINLNYSYQDIPGPNWYMVNVQRVTSIYKPEDFLNPELFTHLEVDAHFMNQLRVNELKVFMQRDFVPGDTLGVFLFNISQDYYKFIELRLDSRFNFSDFLGEPANYPTNIKGGLGFFNLHIPDVQILVLDE